MLSIKVETELHPENLAQAIDRAAFRNLGHAAATIRKDVAGSLLTAQGPSPPGRPPHTHKGAFLRRAIRFDNDKKAQEAVVGPMASVVGTVGEAHEKGTAYRGQQYPARPFMLPALERNRDRFAQEWQGSIGE